MKRGFTITSRIGKRPVPVVDGVSVSIAQQTVTATGPAGEVTVVLPVDIIAAVSDQLVTLTPTQTDPSNNRRVGLYRALIQNAISGAAAPFQKQLQLIGTGFRAEIMGNRLTIRCGFSHPVVIELPAGVKGEVEKNTAILLSGPSKELVGVAAARIRAVSPPDPYKGKGIRYVDEEISLKPGKAAKAVGVTAQ